MLRGLSGRAPSCDIRDRHWPFMPLLDRTKRPATSSIPIPTDRNLIDVSTPLYDSETDIWRGVSEAYQTIRRRQAAGGSGWNPLEKRKSST
jgi:hypothetical protein